MMLPSASLTASHDKFQTLMTSAICLMTIAIYSVEFGLRSGFS